MTKGRYIRNREVNNRYPRQEQNPKEQITQIWRKYIKTLKDINDPEIPVLLGILEIR